MFDYYGVNLEMINRRNEPDINEALTPFKFSPYMSNCLPPNIKVDYLSDNFEKDGFKIESCKKVKRRV